MKRLVIWSPFTSLRPMQVETDQARLMKALMDDPRPRGSQALVRQMKLKPASRVLDLGCGAGKSKAFFAEAHPDAEWHGVDIAESNESRNRPAGMENVKVYDGTTLPYEDASFDIIYSHQVFEHVRYPDALLKDVHRVLRPGGTFVGEVSYLEPYHSHSIFNFTPYGCLEVFGEAGFETRIGPSREALMLIVRSMAGGALRRSIPWFFRFQPTFRLFDLLGLLTGKSRRERALRKLLYSGSFAFLATKPA